MAVSPDHGGGENTDVRETSLSSFPKLPAKAIDFMNAL